MSGAPVYGLMAEFADAERLVTAVLLARREEGYARIEAYSPFALEELNDASGPERSHISFWTLLGALIGGISTFALEWYSAVFNYPLNIGGRPTGSWPAFLPPALEMTVLGAAIFGIVAMLSGDRLPRLHHPLFNLHAFERATSDRFFLVLRSDAPGFDLQRARSFLETLAPLSVTEVSQ